MKKFKKTVALITALAAVSAFIPLGITAAPPEYDLDDFWGCELYYGDCNLDGEFNESDVMMLKQYLLGKGELSYWRNADFNHDDKINVFDLCLMKKALLEALKIYSSAVYSSVDREYQMNFSIVTDYQQKSDVTVTWIDPDGDKEKTDIFTLNGNPFTSDGHWEDNAVFTDSENYRIEWGETSVSIGWNDQEITLDYPDRTRTIQTLSKNIVNSTSPEITAVDLSAESYGNITQKASIAISRNVFVNDTVGRVGSAIKIDTDASIDSYDITLHYDESELRWVPEDNLIVLAYDEQYQNFPESPEVTLDTENHTISFAGKENYYYVVVDAYQWYSVWFPGTSAYAYSVSDITQYISNWERNGVIGDVMELADKEWAKNNLKDNTFTVSTVEELASAVYYLNAFQDIRTLLPKGSSEEINIILEDDIDLDGYDWVPITTYHGELNGNGHTIKNMTLLSSHEIGFIHNAQDAVIHDINFENASVTVKTNIATAGIVAAKQELPYSPKFENVHVSGSMTIPEKGTYGGILGQGNGTFINCSADVTVNGSINCPYLSSKERVANFQLNNGEEIITLTLDLDAKTITRTSEESIDDYTIVIIRDGEQILARDFTKKDILEMTIIPKYTLEKGNYQTYVITPRNGSYQRVSNVISYEIAE